VKTNKEYTAMLHEIEGVEKDIRGKEDVVLQEMEAAESLQGTVKREEQEFKRIEEKHRSVAATLDAEQREISTQVDHLRAERDTVVAALTSEARELYERVAKKRGTGVAEARDGMCQQCHLTLRPQLYVDLKKQDQVIQCPGCQRILFYDPPAPPAPAPA
jgi:predicted  nucleic acid-binding Zn-ribbon protein